MHSQPGMIQEVSHMQNQGQPGQVGMQQGQAQHMPMVQDGQNRPGMAVSCGDQLGSPQQQQQQQLQLQQQQQQQQSPVVRPGVDGQGVNPNQPLAPGQIAPAKPPGGPEDPIKKVRSYIVKS